MGGGEEGEGDCVAHSHLDIAYARKNLKGRVDKLEKIIE